MSAPTCLFCKIVSGELRSEPVAESEYSFAFRDIEPVAPVHRLGAGQAVERPCVERRGQGVGERAGAGGGREGRGVDVRRGHGAASEACSSWEDRTARQEPDVTDGTRPGRWVGQVNRRCPGRAEGSLRE